MLREKTCCFTGHRVIESGRHTAIQHQLKKQIEALIQEGFLYFCCGGALGFDTLAAQTVLECKENHPQIQLILALPCRTQEQFWKNNEKLIYHQILKRADKIIYTSFGYYKGCMHLRNQYMVNHASCVIAYLKTHSGGTKHTVNYAEKSGCRVVYLQA